MHTHTYTPKKGVKITTYDMKCIDTKYGRGNHRFAIWCITHPNHQTQDQMREQEQTCQNLAWKIKGHGGPESPNEGYVCAKSQPYPIILFLAPSSQQFTFANIFNGWFKNVPFPVSNHIGRCWFFAHTLRLLGSFNPPWPPWSALIQVAI